MTSWFFSTVFGRYLIIGAAAVALVGVAILKAIAIGAAKERAKQTQATLKNVLKRKAVDEEVSRLPDSVARERLRQWSRD